MTSSGQLFCGVVFLSNNKKACGPVHIKFSMDKVGWMFERNCVEEFSGRLRVEREMGRGGGFGRARSSRRMS